jgi:hypothetical protein
VQVPEVQVVQETHLQLHLLKAQMGVLDDLIIQMIQIYKAEAGAVLAKPGKPGKRLLAAQVEMGQRPLFLGYP